MNNYRYNCKYGFWRQNVYTNTYLFKASNGTEMADRNQGQNIAVGQRSVHAT